MSELHSVDRVEMVLDGPTRPDASDGWCGIDEDAIHVDEQASAEDFDHRTIL
jgi:hypothetical protein